MGNAVTIGLKKMPIYQKQPVVSPTGKMKIGVSAGLGVIIGIATSFVVNATLIEISLNKFFSLYFGVLFVALGLLIIYRIHTNKSEILQSRKKFLFFFSLMIIVSGVLSFLLDKSWFSANFMGERMKIPLYGIGFIVLLSLNFSSYIVGMSMTYAIIFTFIDLLNIIFGAFQKAYSKPIVESHFQIYLIMAVSVLMGCIYGLLFGYMDLEDNIFKEGALIKQEYLCIPIGISLGGVGGALNEYFRQTGADYREIPKMDNYEAEI